MAAKSRDSTASVIDVLTSNPERFDFFQALRVVERAISQPRLQGTEKRRYPVGYDRAPNQEVARFSASPSLRFAAAPLSHAERFADAEGTTAPFRFLVSFMGLTGQSGALPDQFTELVIQRIRQRDPTLQAFLDVFNHRLISLFFRAWEKYQISPVWERAQIDPEADDPFDRVMTALIGTGQPSLKSQMAVGDHVLQFYAGLLARQPRSANGLERMLSEAFGAACRVKQFEGRWLNIATEEQSAISGKPSGGAYVRLGVDAVCGDRVWDQQSCFRVQIGPLPYRQFERLTPGGIRLEHLCDLVRFYVGPELSFVLQLLLPGHELPDCVISTDDDTASRLGVDAWLAGTDPAAVVADVTYDIVPFAAKAGSGSVA